MLELSREVNLTDGVIRYSDSGSGPPLVFLHGIIASGTIWHRLVPHLEGEYRCIVPTFPMGSHTIPMRPDADTTIRGQARLLDDFLDALGLVRATLVGTDTGAAVHQVFTADSPERVDRLVLMSAEAFDHYLPIAFRVLKAGAFVPGGFTATMRLLTVPPARRLPNTFALLMNDVDDRLIDGWIDPYLASRGVRRDTLKFARSLGPAPLHRAARQLTRFERPALIVWSAGRDIHFPFRIAERLAETLPDSRIVRIEDTRSFIPLDQPRALAAAISEFLAETPADPVAVASA